MKNILIYILTLFTISQSYSQSNPSDYIIKFDDKSIVQYYDANLKLKQLSDLLINNQLNTIDRTKLQQQLDSIELEKETIFVNYSQAISNINKAIDTLVGELSFQFNGQWYDGVIVNTDKSHIKMHWLHKNNGVLQPYKSLLNAKNDLETKGYKILMLTNGGMYLENNTPQGLFIQEGKIIVPIDLDSNKYGNFYMKPNGIFYVDNTGKCSVTSTNAYNLTSHNNVDFATQSGPMLVINGKIHNRFNHQSKNLYLRSGVGILSENKVVFIISQSNQINFHDFAVVFKDVIGCKNALYLDGAISKMYLKNLRNNDLGGNFGAIISITE